MVKTIMLYSLEMSLHIEMAMLAAIGDWLGGSGSKSVMTTAGVTTEGRVLELQKGSHTSRSQWAHQVSASALFILLKKAYEDYQHTTPDVELLSFDDWSKHITSTRPQFHYWHNVLQSELLFLKFLISQRDPNFDMNVESLDRIIPWMFALDRYCYTHLMTIHVKDLLKLQLTCPTIYAEFQKGNFVTQKTRHKFSSLAADQVHE